MQYDIKVLYNNYVSQFIQLQAGDRVKEKTMGRAKRTRKAKKSKNFLLYFLLVIVTLYVLYMIVDQQIKISNAKAELAQVDEIIFTQKQKNSELKKVSDAVKNNDEKAFAGYVERIAREELDYVKNGEIVFINIAGDWEEKTVLVWILK